MKINPKIVDGEPVCSCDDCEQFEEMPRGLSSEFYCSVVDCEIGRGDPCIPALKMQRDRLVELLDFDIATCPPVRNPVDNCDLTEEAENDRDIEAAICKQCWLEWASDFGDG